MPSISFVLSEFESSVTMGVAGAVDLSSPSITSDAAAVIEVALADMQAVFKYQTDSYDFTDASSDDVKYYVDSASWPSNSKLTFSHPIILCDESIAHNARFLIPISNATTFIYNLNNMLYTLYLYYI